MERLGERVRRQREHKGLHLSELAKQVGVTSSCLSQIENGKAFPSILTFKKIADELNTTIGELIGEKESLVLNPVVKKDDKKFVKNNSNGTKLYLLSHHETNKLMETYSVVFDVDSDSSQIMTLHPGQAFCYVEEGILEMDLADEKYVLHQGDSIFFYSNISHKIRNINQGSSELLWIITPTNI